MTPNIRKYFKESPGYSSKKILLFCEGVKREKQYFDYFSELDSRIDLFIYNLNPTENNSPMGLFELAKTHTISPKKDCETFKLKRDDEVWIIFDTDIDNNNTREKHINKVRKEVETLNNFLLHKVTLVLKFGYTTIFFHLLPLSKIMNFAKHGRIFLILK